MLLKRFPRVSNISMRFNYANFEKLEFISWQLLMFINYGFIALRIFFISFIQLTVCKQLWNDKFYSNKKFARINSFLIILKLFLRLRKKKMLKISSRCSARRKMIYFYDFFASSDSFFRAALINVLYGFKTVLCKCLNNDEGKGEEEKYIERNVI